MIAEVARLRVDPVVTGKKKRNGAFYTPEILAKYLVSWAVQNITDKIIEPCIGDGVFLDATADRLLKLGADKKTLHQITGIEIDSDAAKEASKKMQLKYGVTPSIITKGFFASFPSLPKESYTVAIGNPPFIRYQTFMGEERDLAIQLLVDNGFKGSKLTNAWVPFLVASSLLLRKGGRLAMVLPAELLQVSYAQEIREYLLNHFGSFSVINFTNLVFPGVEQEIVLLMGIKGASKGLRFIEIKDLEGLEELSFSKAATVFPIQNGSEKWTQFFLCDSERRALSSALNNPLITRLEKFCTIDIGVVTGANKYFLLNKIQAEALNAPEHLIPIVGRSRQLHGIEFSGKDLKVNEDVGLPIYLLMVKPILGLPNSVIKYIKFGEENKVNRGFKCSSREPWYIVPSIWTPDAFLFRQSGSAPRLVLNSTKAISTDTIHRVKFKTKEKRDIRSLIAGFHNSLTFAFAEIVGRSYGGGVLELMPTEAEKLPVPNTTAAGEIFSDVDTLIRNKNLPAAVDLVDKVVLHDELGFSQNEINLFRKSWLDLSNRRKARRYM